MRHHDSEANRGRIVQIRPNGFPRLGASENDPKGTWFDHTIVEKEGRIYDAYKGPRGMPAEEYWALFKYAGDINFGFN